MADELLLPQPAHQSSSSSSATGGKYHVRMLERGSPFKNRHLRSDFLEEVRNAQPRVLEVVDFPMEDADVFDGNSKRFDDYGHSRFGKRNGFDDYGHSRFGR